jgi:hypothetical protein
MRFLLILTAALFLSGCQTAFDVQDLGSGRYGVSSLACPACGGTAKSAQLAYEQAEGFCAARGQIVVMESRENELANAVGAGRTDMVFECADEVTAEDSENCYAEGFSDLKLNYSDALIDKAISVVIPPENGFPFIMLASQETVSDDEVGVLTAVGGIWEDCSGDAFTNAPVQSRNILNAASKRTLAALAKLIASKSTYGEYAAEVNEIIAGTDSQLSEVEREARAQRASEARDRIEASSRLRGEIQGAFDTTTCVTTGNSTTCR